MAKEAPKTQREWTPKELLRKARRFEREYRVTNGDRFRLKDFDPRDTLDFDDEDKPRSKEALAAGVQRARRPAGPALRAGPAGACSLIFQAMDAAGKDGAIKHVMSGVNPQGCQVHSFKAPTQRGPRPRLPLAVHEGAAEPRQHRHLQPLVLRGDAGRPRAPRVPRRPEAPEASA